jgi:DNA topoisomerase-3
MPNQQYLRAKVIFSSKETGGETFSWSGNQILKPGFTAVFPWKDSESQSSLPDTIKQGEFVELVDVRINEGQTSPPNYLTESDLIGMMEKLGIGTDAHLWPFI